jgi:ABC-type multidrug transport system fused ATPase/permease subunit
MPVPTHAHGLTRRLEQISIPWMIYWEVSRSPFLALVGISFVLLDSLRMFASTLSAILGAVILISIILPWFLIGVACISIVYVYVAIFYRASARELKVRPIILAHCLSPYWLKRQITASRYRLFALCSTPAIDLTCADAILRSSLYSHFSESLYGLATIRAYGESERFRLDNERRVDVENRYVIIHRCLSRC